MSTHHPLEEPLMTAPLLTLPKLRACMPKLPPARESWCPILGAAMDEFDINTVARMAPFLAQAAHESSELATLSENLNYSWGRLLAVWPLRFGRGRGATAKDRAVGEARAKALHRQPMAIANYVYGGRNGNGPEISGDGWRYRGRGIFQLTGRANYAAAGEALGLPLEEDPDLVAIDPAAACRTAGHFWSSRRLSALADRGDFLGISKAINLGSPAAKGEPNGMAERLAFWVRAKAALAA